MKMKVSHFEINEVERIRQHLSNQPRNLLLFNLGINSGCRMSDLLRLKIQDFIDKKVNEVITITEKKTGKTNYIVLNKVIYKTFHLYLKSLDTKYNEDDYLFSSRKGNNQPITIQHTIFIIKDVCKTLGITKNVGSHSLRKTFGYIHRKHNGVGIEVLQKRFNHSSQSITFKYIGMSEKEVETLLQTSI